MRKLASIQKVLNLIPIPNADAIELAQINGWQCVVKKGEFPIGSLGVYFEIDAIPPIEGAYRELFSFLWRGQEKPAPSLRIRTMRLRGALSQGLLMPLSSFSEVEGLTDGTDCTELLGVHKYEPPPPDGMGDYGGPFPGDISKTDEIRIQSMPSLLDEMVALPYCITEKCDGTSATFTWADGKFAVCGRNHMIAEADNIFWRAAKLYNLEQALKDYPVLALQGEVVGPGINKNRMGLKRVELRAFNLYDKQTGRHLPQDELEWFCSAHKIPMARVVEREEQFDHTVASLLELAEGHYEGTTNEREGIVIRPLVPQYSPMLGGRLSFKAISNRYLLRGGD